jgi:hypothetical protein
MCFGFNRQLYFGQLPGMVGCKLKLTRVMLIKEKEDVHTPSSLLSWFSVGTPVFMTCHIAMGATQ